MVRCSKAAPIVSVIVRNLCGAVGVKTRENKHSKKSDQDDKAVLNVDIQNCQPFNNLNRDDNRLNDIQPCASFNVHIDELHCFVERHCMKALDRVY